MGLKRVLGATDAAWLVAGNMIGAGIFIFPGLVAAHLPGLGWPLVAWLLGGLLALCGAAVYAELGVRIPRAGGDYQYLATAFGPAWGFLTGWAAMLLTFSAAAAVMSITAVDYLGAALPLPVSLAASLSDGIARRVVPPIIVLLLTVANTAGARIAGRTTAWFTGLPLAGLFLLFAYGLLSGRAELNWPETWVWPGRSWPVALGAAMIFVYFTYSGWNAAAYLAGEIRNPARDLVRGLLGGTAMVTLVYLAINLILLIVVPTETLAGSTTSGAHAARILIGPVAERGLAVMIAVAVLGSANVTLMAGARIYYAMSRDGLTPRALSRTNAAGVPSTALWVGGVWSAGLAATGQIGMLTNWATLAILLLSSLAVTALFVFRRRGIGQSAYCCPGYPVTPVVYLLASLGVACASAIEQPRQSLYGVLIVAAGLPVYLAVRRVGAQVDGR